MHAAVAPRRGAWEACCLPPPLSRPAPPLPSHAQVGASSFAGVRLQARAAAARPAARPALAVVAATAADEDERLRLSNLSPQPGSKKKENRKGRGYGAGQVRSARA